MNLNNLNNLFNGNNLANEDDLSPVSSLRLNFDRLPTETTDPVTPTKNVFGVPVPQFVPESIISWLDTTANDSTCNQTNQTDTQSDGSPSEQIIFSNRELNGRILRKVWTTWILLNVLVTNMAQIFKYFTEFLPCIPFLSFTLHLGG